VLKRLDYGNAAQAGLPSYLHRRLLLILVGRRRIHRSDLFTDTLASFHWLRSTERIHFKLANIVYRSLHGTSLGYLSSELAYIVWHWISTTGDNPPGEMSAIKLPPLLDLGRETVCLPILYTCIPNFLRVALAISNVACVQINISLVILGLEPKGMIGL
jgi:hypothetical protein